MTKHQGKYRVTKRFRLDFEICVLARNEDEAVIRAESAEIGAWGEFDSSWEFMNAEQVRPTLLW